MANVQCLLPDIAYIYNKAEKRREAINQGKGKKKQEESHSLLQPRSVHRIASQQSQPGM